MPIERTLSRQIMKADQRCKALIITGPPEVGKAALLEMLAGQARSRLSLTSLEARVEIREDPVGFLENVKLPVLMDGIQHVPEWLSDIKVAMNRDKSLNGQFWITSSQSVSTLKTSLDDVAVFSMLGLSLAEELGRADTPPFVPSQAALEHRHSVANVLSKRDIFYKIWRGSYPTMVCDENANWQAFYDDYILTYIERDARAYLNIDDLVLFRKFMQVLAARTGQVLNFRPLSKEVGVSEPTVKVWFDVLHATGLVMLVPAYLNDADNRILKTPKFYFTDTGLCCFLTRWNTPEALQQGAMAASMLETYVASEILKTHLHHGREPALYHYADKEQREVDLLIEYDGHLHPIEIRKTGSIVSGSFKGFDFLQKLPLPIGHGCILCFGQYYGPVTQSVDSVPIGYL